MLKKILLGAVCATMLVSAPAALAQVDTVVCNQLTAQAQAAQEAIDAAREAYEQSAARMDERIALANTTAQNGENVEPLWRDVIATRDEMKPRAQQALSTVNDGFATMQAYVAANCTTQTKDEVEQRHIQATKLYQDRLTMLASLPDDWRQRYGRYKAASNPAICAALQQKHKDADATAKNYSLANDDKIAAYRKARLAVNEAIDLERPFDEAWKTLVDARKAALPGVNGYGDVISKVFKASIDNIEQGCVAMSAAREDAVRKNATDILLEIRQSRLLINDMLLDKQSYEQDRSKTTTPRIGIINNTDEILCIHTNAQGKGKCVIKPHGSKIVELETSNPSATKDNNTASLVQITGGVKWLKGVDGNVKAGQMSVCKKRSFDHKTGSKAWIIEPGIEDGCTAPQIP